MAWVVPEYSATQIDFAGAWLSDRAQRDVPDPYGIINNWRSSHGFPLNTIQNGIRRKAYEVDAGALIAQRIKRLSSIRQKLVMQPTMKLSKMQDIGGCRAIVSNIAMVGVLADNYSNSAIKHRAARFDDYISNPKPSGYRGMHLVYRYYSDSSETYNGLRVEIQLRSVLQHAWATAVETVGTFTEQALKSSKGDAAWLRFFTLMGSEIALLENTPLVPNTPTDRRELLDEVREHARSLDVVRSLRAYQDALRTIGTQEAVNAHYFLLVLEPTAETVRIYGFLKRELPEAQRAYSEAERHLSEAQGAAAVLVSVDSINSLQRAFPNYFLDTTKFLEVLTSMLNVAA